MKKPYLKLRRLIEDKGLEQQELAVLTGIGLHTLNRRINAPENSGHWLPSEITAICGVLHIPQEQIGYYFFPGVAPGNQKEVSA